MSKTARMEVPQAKDAMDKLKKIVLRKFSGGLFFLVDRGREKGYNKINKKEGVTLIKTKWRIQNGIN